MVAASTGWPVSEVKGRRRHRSREGSVRLLARAVRVIRPPSDGRHAPGGGLGRRASAESVFPVSLMIADLVPREPHGVRRRLDLGGRRSVHRYAC